MDNQISVTKQVVKKQSRQDKAKALTGSVMRNKDGSYSVPSQSNPDKVYEVVHFNHKFGCSCPDFLCRNVEACKHILAVKLYIEQQQQQKATQIQTPVPAPAKTTMTKTFDSFSELNKWVNSELANKLYKIGQIDWAQNTVKLEGRELNWK